MKSNKIESEYEENGIKITRYKTLNDQIEQRLSSKSLHGACIKGNQKSMHRKIKCTQNGYDIISDDEIIQSEKSLKSNQTKCNAIKKKALLTAKKLVREEMVKGGKLEFCEKFIKWNDPDIKYCSTILGWAKDIVKQNNQGMRI